MPSDVIQLDVGGQLFRTTKSTLCSVDGYFSAMLQGGHWGEDKQDAPIFIDRDPLTFPSILSYLRSRKVIFSPQDDYIYLQKLQIEADYFQLQELCHAIEAELNKRNSSSSTEDNNNDFIYRSVRAAEVNAFFNRAWEYVGHYQGNESVACLVSMTGSKVEALFLNGHCSACGEAMSFEKFCRHTSIIHPSMIVIRRKKPSKNVDSGEEELLDQSSMSEILENFLL